MVTLKAIYSLFLLDRGAASSIRPTPMATFDKVPYGVALLQVSILYDDLAHEMVANHLAGLLRKYLKTHPKEPIPALERYFSYYLHLWSLIVYFLGLHSLV